MGDLQEADNLLQKAIKKVEGSTKTDSAQVTFISTTHDALPLLLIILIIH